MRKKGTAGLKTVNREPLSPLVGALFAAAKKMVAG